MPNVVGGRVCISQSIILEVFCLCGVYLTLRRAWLVFRLPQGDSDLHHKGLRGAPLFTSLSPLSYQLLTFTSSLIILSPSY
jgi:hypothetical protein